MRSLWFKAKYVGPILRGEKVDTIRNPDGRAYRVGQAVALCVGPRRPFARAVVTAFDLVKPGELGDRLAEVRAIYGDLPAYRRLAFRVTDVLEADDAAPN